MAEVVQSVWGDWLVVSDGRIVAVHMRWQTAERTCAGAVDHARRLFPGEAIRVCTCGSTDVVHELPTDEPHPLGRERDGGLGLLFDRPQPLLLDDA